MDLKNVKKIMQMSSQLQSRMTEIQDRLAHPEALEQANARKLEEKVHAAVAQAQKLANKAMESEMKKATGGLSLPGLGSLMGS